MAWMEGLDGEVQNAFISSLGLETTFLSNSKILPNERYMHSTHAFIPASRRQNQADLYEFKNTLVYTVSPEVAKTTQ